MPTPPDLVKTISKATGLPLATVTDLDRRLAKANLRPIGGRGPNAAKMGPLEAARLLTAILASAQSNEAAEAVLRYSQTRPDKARSSDGMFGGLGLDDLASLPARHGFVDGLTALITSAATGSLAKLLAGTPNTPSPRIEIFTLTHATQGRIRIAGLSSGLSASVEYVPAITDSSPRKSRAGRSKGGTIEALGDLEQSRRITDQTIFAIANLFAEQRGRDH